MMKKISFLIVIFLLGLSVSFADSIGEISVSFCNSGSDGRSLNFVVNAGVPYPFCVDLSTTSTEKIPVSLGFVNGEITNDELHNKACSHQGSSFAQYINFAENTTINLVSGSSIQKTGTIMFPLGYSGEVHGCLVYSVPNIKSSIKQGNSLLNVVVRKANFIDGYVVGDFKRNIEFDSSLVDYYIDKEDNALVILLPFDNLGILPEFLQFTGTLSNILGYERLVTSSKIINYGTSSLVEFRFADIPFYKGVYGFFFQGSSVLDTRLDLSYISDKYKQKIDFSYDKNIILVPWILIFGIIGFFVALFVLRRILKIILRR